MPQNTFQDEFLHAREDKILLRFDPMLLEYDNGMLSCTTCVSHVQPVSRQGKNLLSKGSSINLISSMQNETFKEDALSLSRGQSFTQGMEIKSNPLNPFYYPIEYFKDAQTRDNPLFEVMNPQLI